MRIACAPLQACARQVYDLQHIHPGSKKFVAIGPKTAGIPPCENFSPRRKITARSGGKSSENPGENTSKPAGNHAVLRPKTVWRLRTHAHTHARAGAGPTAPLPPYCGFCGGLSGDRWGEINYSGRDAGGGVVPRRPPGGRAEMHPSTGTERGSCEITRHARTRGGSETGRSGVDSRKPEKTQETNRVFTKAKKGTPPPGRGMMCEGGENGNLHLSKWANGAILSWAYGEGSSPWAGRSARSRGCIGPLRPRRSGGRWWSW